MREIKCSKNCETVQKGRYLPGARDKCFGKVDKRFIYGNKNKDGIELWSVYPLTGLGHDGEGAEGIKRAFNVCVLTRT